MQGTDMLEKIREKLTKEKIKKFLITLVEFLLNPRFLLCFGIAWIITNGWSYILLVIGSLLKIRWMITVATAYLAFLWLPVSPEKIVTIAISMALLRWLFPEDEKTLGILRRLHEKAKIRRIRWEHEREEKHREEEEKKEEKEENRP